MTNNNLKNNSLAKNQEEIELKRIREDLEDLEIYIEEFSRFLPLPVCTINPLGKIININRAFTDLTGYEEIDIIGQDIKVLFVDKKEAEILGQEIFKKEKIPSKEITILASNKNKIPVNASASLRRDRENNIIGYFLAFSDIREIKQFQEKLEKRVEERTKELEESRRALTNILEDVAEAREKAEEEKNKTLAIIINFTDGLLVFDEINNLALINPQAEIFFTIKHQEIIGKSIQELSTYSALKPLTRLLGLEIRELFRKELVLREGLVLEVSTIPIIRENKKTGTLVILHDVTRGKMVEQMKTEFVSLAAHQLRTPLSAIKWTLQMLLAGDLGPINEEQREFIEKTYRSNERMIALINDLLNVTRIEEGRYLYKLTLADIKELVQKVIDSLKADIQRKKIKFKFEKPSKKIRKIRVDAEKITLAVQNLINNAIQYTPISGEVIVSLRRVEDDIEFSVKDAGIGIPKDQQDRVFTKFFRGANAIRMETEGTGLGLYIAKNIIEAHGGGIWFESEENKGSTFSFVLPIKEEFKEFLEEF